MRRHFLGLCLASALLLCSCGGTKDASPQDGYMFVDALGREVTVEQPQRVAAMMGGFADVWLLAGGELEAVTDDAVTERGLLPENTVVNLGFYNTPSLEALLGCAPDFMLLSAETQAHVALADTLEQAGILTAYFSVTHFEDYLHMLDICTSITGNRGSYEENGIKIQTEIQEILKNIPKQEAPTVLLMITHSGGAAVQNGETMTGRMLQELGCINLADENPSLLADMSMEYIIDSDPDFIFVVPMGGNDVLAREHLQELTAQHPAWIELSAVQNGQYIVLPKEGFLYKPNAAWAESYRYLAGVLYGKG